MKHTKKPFMLLCLLLTLLQGAALLPEKKAQLCGGVSQGQVLRLHILANSDSEEDQAIKLQVRDALLPLFSARESYTDARAFILSHGAELLSRCQEALSELGAGYGAQLFLGVSEFPDRTYGAGAEAVFFPAGAYDALQIILGAGQGHNWWCVLFPPLCVVTEDGEAPQELGGFRFESDLLAFLKRRLGGRP